MKCFSATRSSRRCSSRTPSVTRCALAIRAPPLNSLALRAAAAQIWGYVDRALEAAHNVDATIDSRFPGYMNNYSSPAAAEAANRGNNSYQIWTGPLAALCCLLSPTLVTELLRAQQYQALATVARIFGASSSGRTCSTCKRANRRSAQLSRPGYACCAALHFTSLRMRTQIDIWATHAASQIYGTDGSAVRDIHCISNSSPCRAVVRAPAVPAVSEQGQHLPGLARQRVPQHPDGIRRRGKQRAALRLVAPALELSSLSTPVQTDVKGISCYRYKVPASASASKFTVPDNWVYYQDEYDGLPHELSVLSCSLVAKSNRRVQHLAVLEHCAHAGYQGAQCYLRVAMPLF